jgi:glutathione S-transferase
MLKVWGRRNSINVQKVLWVLDELDLAYERIDAGMEFGVTYTPEYLAKNPNGLVPTLADGAVMLWESNAIVRYLAAKHGDGGLWPSDPAARALSDRWMDWVLTQMIPALTPPFRNLIRTPPMQRSQPDIDAGIRRMEKLWPMVEQALGDLYIAGDRLTVGDISLGVCVYRWRMLPIERPSLPKLEAYFDRLSERPAYQNQVMVGLT